MPRSTRPLTLGALLIFLILCLTALLFRRDITSLVYKAIPPGHSYTGTTSPDGRFHIVVAYYPRLRDVPFIFGCPEGCVELRDALTGTTLATKQADQLSPIGAFQWSSGTARVFYGHSEWATWALPK